MKLYSQCVYTIVDDDALLDADHGSAPSEPMPEGKKWKAIKTWLQSARALGEHVPIVFADAKCVHRWLGWGVLVDVEVEPIDMPPSETRYQFQHLRPLLGHRRSDGEFRLLETGNPLSDTDRRPYRHLRTPPFLSGQINLEEQPLLSEWLRRPDAVEYAFTSTYVNASDQDAARNAMGRAIAVADEIAPDNWRVVLTPGRIRVFVGSEIIIDMGNKAGEFRYWYWRDSEDDEDEHIPLSAYPEFFQGQKFRRFVETVRATPLTDLPHAAVVLKYLEMHGSRHPRRANPEAIASVVPAAPTETGAAHAAALRAEGEAIVPPFDPNDEQDGRRRVLADLVRRQGQSAFRRALLRAYGGQCAITGWQVEDVLEAAHIVPYRGPHTNHVSNGLLLRSDLHALFDLDLIKIDPNTYSILVDPTLLETPYGGLHGQPLRLPADAALYPSREYLQYRANSSSTHALR